MALDAYNRAGDHESRIRLLLSKNRPAEAEEIVREHQTTEGANLGLNHVTLYNNHVTLLLFLSGSIFYKKRRLRIRN